MDKNDKAPMPQPVRLVASTSQSLDYHYQPVAVSAHAMSTKVYEAAGAMPETGGKRAK